MKSKKFFALLTLFALLSLCLTAAAWAAMSDEDFVHLCERGSAQKIRAALKKGANPNAMAEGIESASVGTALMWAACANTPEVVSILLKAGADFNAKDEDGRTALMWAACENTAEVVSILLKAGADINVRDNYDSTMLIRAAQNCENPDVITVLVKAGADVNARDKEGETALIRAAQLGTPDGISALLDAGADVNAKDNEGRTALMWAATNTEEMDSLKLLLKAGADINAKDNSGDTVFNWARERGLEDGDAVKILESWTASQATPQTANASIVGDNVNVRSKPNTSSRVVKQLNTGHPVTIVRQDGDWYLIRTANGTDGWVFGKYVKRLACI